MTRRAKVLLAGALLSVPVLAFGQAAPGTPAAAGHMLDSVVDAFAKAAESFENVVATRASWLFGTLALIELTYSLIECALKNGGIQDIFAILIRRIFWFGFFFEVLSHAHEWANMIVNSFLTLGEVSIQAANFPTPYGGVPVTGALTPSAIAEIGLQLAFVISDAIPGGITSIGIAVVMGWVALVILIAMSAMAVKQVIVLCEMYIALTGGIIFLGFGASRWTKDYATNYLRYCVSVGVKLFFVQLTVAVSTVLIRAMLADTSPWTLGRAMGMMIVVFVIACVVWAIPNVAAGVASGQHSEGTAMERMSMMAMSMSMNSVMASAKQAPSYAGKAAKAMRWGLGKITGDGRGGGGGGGDSGGSQTSVGGGGGGKGGGGSGAGAKASGLANGMSKPAGAPSSAAGGRKR